MDFLDPRKKRTRTIRLMMGYCLMAIAIGLATTILVYGASGYGIDTKTGQITENGLLFVDTKPGGANIYLNGVDQNKTTSARMILNAGEYDLSLRKPGYREWKRSFTLDEHSIKRYVYPFLFPEQLKPQALKSYASMPQLVTETLDRRWLLVQTSTASGNLAFDMYDTEDFQEPSRLVNLPANLLSNYDPAHSQLIEVEWSTDNDHLLLQHRSPSGSEFVIIDRTSPQDSININRVFNHNPSQVVLRDKRVSQLYFYDESTRSIRVADVNDRRLEPVLIQDVFAFKTYGRNLITYITSAGAADGTMATRIWDNGRTYPLNKVTAGSKYLIDVAQFQGDWYYVAASDTDQRISIYKDPLDYVKDKKLRAAPPMIAFDLPGATALSFSANTRFLNIQAGSKFGVYDFEAEEKYQYEMLLPLAAPMVWMDGHRLMGTSGGSVLIMDYDSTNQQILVPSLFAEGGFFSRDYNQFYTLAPEDGTAAVLTRVDMRTGDDLPEEFR